MYPQYSQTALMVQNQSVSLYNVITVKQHEIEAAQHKTSCIVVD